MSFWAGLGRAMESNEAQRNVEAARDEREEARDERKASEARAEAFRGKQWASQLEQQALTNSRNEVADARQVESHALAMSTGTLAITQKLNGLAGGTGVGDRRTGSIPTAAEMGKGARALRARIDDAGGLDNMTPVNRKYYEPILANAAASYELNNLLAKAVGDDTDLTILNAADRVRTVGIVAAQGQEAFEAYMKEAAKDGWNPEEVLEAMELAKKSNPDFAELVLLTPSKKNLTEQEINTTFEASLQARAVLWSKTNGVTPEFNTAMSSLTSTNEQIKYSAILDLVQMGVGQAWLQENARPGNPLYDVSSKSVSAVPKVGEDGNLILEGNTPPEGIPTFETEADILALSPDEQAALVGKTVIVGGVSGVLRGPELPPEGQPTAVPAWAVETPPPSKVPLGKGRGPNRRIRPVKGPMDDMTQDELMSLLEDKSITEDGIHRVWDVLEDKFPVVQKRGGWDYVPPKRPERTAVPSPSELNTPAVRDALSKVPEEVQQAITSVVTKGSLEDIEQAKQDIVKEFGLVAADALFEDAKSANADVDKRAKYQPPTMMATELNTPAVREALSKVPTEVQQAITSVVTKGSPEDIEQAKQDVTQEYGEAVASILFDDAKSGRGTGKSAMMDGLQ